MMNKRLNKRDSITVCFNMNGHSFKMFKVIQMGKDGVIDLKITDFYNCIALSTKQTFLDDNDCLVADGDVTFVNHMEISYHQDGSFLWKNCDAKTHCNPYGVGERWIPTNEISDFLPILTIQIRSMRPYSEYFKTIPSDKGHNIFYECKCDNLFDFQGTYFLMLMIVDKKMPFCCFGTRYTFSDKIIELNDDFNLCLFICRHNYPKPRPYFSTRLNCYVTPSINNIICPPNREHCKKTIREQLSFGLFNPSFFKLFQIIFEGKYFCLTDDLCKLFDSIDSFFPANDETSFCINAFLKKEIIREVEDIALFNKKDVGEKEKFFKKKILEIVIRFINVKVRI